MDDASHGDPVLSAMFLVRSLLIPPEYTRSMAARLGHFPVLRTWREHGGNIVMGAARCDALRHELAASPRVRRAQAAVCVPVQPERRLSAGIQFAEQMPNPDSRVHARARDRPHWACRGWWCSGGSARPSWTRSSAPIACWRPQWRAAAWERFSSAPISRPRLRQAMVPQGGHNIGTVRMGARSIQQRRGPARRALGHARRLRGGNRRFSRHQVSPIPP